jgi:hypothetical protein
MRLNNRVVARMIGGTAVAAMCLAFGAAAYAEDSDKVAVGDAGQILLSYGLSTIPISPTVTPTAVPPGQWVTALAANFDASKATRDGLIVQTSAVTAILTGDLRAGNGAFVLNWGGVQARVLVNCVLPACDPSSDTVPAANLLDPGVIFLDQTAHLAVDLSDASTLHAALDLAAGARSFNFYKTKIGSARRKNNSVLYQVKFNAGGLAAGDGLTGALVAVAKRTLIMETVDLDSRR